jgi:WD40 repeat protein
MRRSLRLWVFVVSILLTGCSQAEALLPLPTGMSFPTLTPRPTLTFAPTQTATPPPTSTATPLVVARAGTPVVVQSQAINVNNGGQLALLARWGFGIPQALTWSMDGKLLAAGSTRGVWVYATDTQELLWSLDTSSPCRALTFKPDGSRLAVGLQDGRLLLVSAHGSLEQAWQAHAFVVLDVAWSPDGTWLASTSWDKSVKVWNLAKGFEQPVYIFNGIKQFFERLAFSADSLELRAAGRMEGLHTWRLADGKSLSLLGLPLSPAGTPAQSLRFSADGGRLLLGYPGQVRVQRAINGATLALIYLPKEPLYGSAIEPSGERLAFSLPGRVVLRKTAGGQELASLLSTDPLAVYPLMAFSPDGLRLAAAGSGLVVWRTDLEADAVELLPQGWLPGLVTSAAQAGDGWLSSVLLDGSVWRLNPADGAMSQLAAPFGQELSASGWGAVGETAILAGLDLRLRQWIYPGSGWQAVQINRLKKVADCLALSADGLRLALGVGNQVEVYSDLQGKPQLLKIPQRAVAMQFLPDGRLVTTLQGGEVWLWDGSTPVLKLPGVNPVFSADGSTLALAHFDWDSSHVELLRLPGGESMVELPADGRNMAFSPDGSLLATAGRRLQLWSVADGKLLSDLPLSDPGKRLYFTSDGTRLVILSADGVVSMWGVP